MNRMIGSRRSAPTAVRTGSEEQYVLHMRIGPLSLFSLTVMICLAVLAVLVFSTANASLVLSQRQADAVASGYLDECAAQEFVAGMDAALTPVREGRAAEGASTAALVEAALDEACAGACEAVDNAVRVSAHVEGERVVADFEAADGKVLTVTLEVANDGTYRIVGWKMSAVQNEEERDGNLFIAD